MNPVLRGVIVYVFLLIIFRIMGRRTLNEATTFDLVLLLIISEVTQQGLVGEDFSITTAAVLICTLMGLNILLTLLKQSSKPIERVIEGTPLVIVHDGKPLVKRMDKTKVGEDDVMQMARLNFGLERMDEIKYAVLEKDGSITIIPFGSKTS
ncbi:MAG: DUF421 domain-containing protein [Chitinophagaceae bacterium]|nr:DUF421 domain-containing protein [Chitinophagaceae bacterium]